MSSRIVTIGCPVIFGDGEVAVQPFASVIVSRVYVVVTAGVTGIAAPLLYGLIVPTPWLIWIWYGAVPVVTLTARLVVAPSQMVAVPVKFAIGRGST